MSVPLNDIVVLIAKLEMLKGRRDLRGDPWFETSDESEAGRVAFDAIPTLLALEVENAQLRNANAELRRWIEDRTMSIRQIT